MPTGTIPRPGAGVCRTTEPKPQPASLLREERQKIPKRHLLMLLACCLALFGLAACGGSETSGNGGPSKTTETPKQEVTITVYDNYFDPKEVKVPANVPVKVTFVNKGKNVHIVEIKGLTSEETLQPAQSKPFTLTAKEQSYKMYDELFESQGMTGTYQGVKQ